MYEDEQRMRNKHVQVREADHGATGHCYLFHQEKMAGEAVTQTGNDFQGSQGSTPKASWHKARDLGSVPQDGPHPGFGSKSLQALKSADRQTPPATETEPWQEDFKPGTLVKTTGAAGAAEKGS